MVSCALIAEVVAEYYGVPKDEIYSLRRTRQVVIPRHVSFYMARKLTHKSLPEIGRNFGGRDHTTILHACSSMAALRDQNADMARELDQIETVILATEGVIVLKGLAQPDDIDPLLVALRLIGEPLTRMQISGDELRSLARGYVMLANAPEPEPHVVTIDLEPALARAVQEAATAFVQYQTNQFTRDESGALRRFETAFIALKTLFETQATNTTTNTTTNKETVQ
jgi:hypothetical protein